MTDRPASQARAAGINPAALAVRRDTRDRTTHARYLDRENGLIHELVRYDRAGRWVVETFGDNPLVTVNRVRKKTIQDAVAQALEWEPLGGENFLGRSGGLRFDSMIRAAHDRRRRHA